MKFSHIIYTINWFKCFLLWESLHCCMVHFLSLPLFGNNSIYILVYRNMIIFTCPICQWLQMYMWKYIYLLYTNVFFFFYWFCVINLIFQMGPTKEVYLFHNYSNKKILYEFWSSYIFKDTLIDVLHFWPRWRLQFFFPISSSSG